MQNSSLKYDYVKKILVYLIIGISAFQFPIIFTYNATGYEAKFINALNDAPFTSTIIDFITPFLTKYTVSMVILFRALGTIFVAVSVSLFYKTLFDKVDVSILTVATLLFLLNPITQFIFTVAVPFSVTLFAITSIFKVYVEKKGGYKAKVGILSALTIIIASWTSYVDATFLIINFSLILIPLVAYFFGVKVYQFNKVIVYILLIIFIAISVLIKIAPKVSFGSDILYDDRDMKGVSSFLYQKVSDERNLLASNIYDGELVKYYSNVKFKVSKFNADDIKLPAIILSDKELDLNALKQGADSTLAGIYSASSIDRKIKYYIYNVK